MEGVIIFIAYFLIYFFLTTLIYTNNYFLPALILSGLIPVALHVFPATSNPSMAYAGSMFIFYVLLLLVIRIIYKKLNAFFIRHKLVSPVFFNKDFTFVIYGSDGSDDIWDEKRMTFPSWFDHLLSYGLLIVPMLLMVCLYIICGPDS